MLGGLEEEVLAEAVGGRLMVTEDVIVLGDPVDEEEEDEVDEVCTAFRGCCCITEANRGPTL